MAAHRTVNDDEDRGDEQRQITEQQLRPNWDVELLKAAGFRDTRVDTTVWQRIYHNVDEFYNPTPIFLIAARA